MPAACDMTTPSFWTVMAVGTGTAKPRRLFGMRSRFDASAAVFPAFKMHWDNVHVAPLVHVAHVAPHADGVAATPDAPAAPPTEVSGVPPVAPADAPLPAGPAPPST